MKSDHWTRSRTARAVSTCIAVVALMSSILTVGLQSVAGAASVVGTTPVGTNPLDVARNSADTFAYVANFGSNTVSVIQLSNSSVVATVPVGTNPCRVVVDPTNTYAYVANAGDNTVSVIQLSTNTVVGTPIALPGGATPEQIFVNSSNTDAYVVDRGTNAVSVIALPANTVTTPMTTGLNSPEGIFVNSTDAYVTNRGAGTVSEISLSTNLVVATIPVGTAPTRIGVNPAGTDLYVTNSGSNNVSVIQVSTNSVVATIPVGATPDAVAVDPTNTDAYVSNSGSTTVSVILVSTNAVIQTQTVGAAPEGIIVNSAGTYAYVANYSSGTISVINVANHTTTFNGNGFTSGSMATETNNVPSALTANGFVKTGYTFAGWNTLANGTGTAYVDGATYPFALNATLYAQWTATVTFNGNGSTSGSMATEANSVPTALSANAFVKTGYSFSGWNTLANGTGTPYAAGATYPFALNTTLYAQWTVNPSYTVTFSGNASTSGSMATETNNAPTALSANAFSRSGYSFVGWNTAANGTGTAYAAGATYPFTSSATLYAQWKAITSYIVTFNGNGFTSGSMATETNNAPTALSANAFSRSGYSFAGWNTAANGTGTAYAAGATYPFTSSATLYAQWVADFHTVTFNRNGATGGTMRAETAHAPTALSRNAFVRTGYTFSSWNTAANGKGSRFAPGAIYPFTASVNLFAQWTPIPAHANRIIGSVAAGQTRHIIIVGRGFFNGAHVTSNERGTIVRVGRSAATEIFLTVTVRKNSPRGRHIFTIVTASKRICRIVYIVR